VDLAEIKDVSIFTPLVGSQFEIEIDDEDSVSAELVEASGSTGKSFSLLFAVNDGMDLPQRVYRISHEELGDVQLFMVPLGNGRLESVFN
jgi:hypothetical protein